MQTPVISLFYDDREHAESIIVQLSKHDDLSLIKKRLTLGDYQINEWLIERKTLPDLVLSLCDGRLFSQIARLAESDFNVALLIEGKSQDIIEYKIHREALIGALCAISIHFHIPVIRSQSQTETAKLLYYCAKQLNHHTSDLKLTGRKPKRQKNRQLFILQSLPQVGPKLAKRLLCHFLTVEAVMTASENELIQVEGIGKKKAKKIRKILTASYY
ncbi:ERCC4 domain-containing protein [Shewanella surugensis]|uniref:Helix-hairpin-helix domain-containing protein n=1 Tax=Shewanella surugensis TaxID=212020 RepID=A0ABT0L7B6_9GAMM|nr:ERCC4 domain-containing protein [Shewanella surugensis]MCL1123566.1 helix-hairpin-helix domain-containing protein [Shewanella surugensis]